MRGFVAPTDHAWWQFLRARPELREVNFWRPGGGSFRALAPGEPFFFKLKAPHDAIGGFGLFARFDVLPVWRAWDVFGRANGTADAIELLGRLGRLAASGPVDMDRPIGCVAVVEPVFFAPDEWVPTPADWHPTIVRGAAYDLERGDGARLWAACLERAAARRTAPQWTLEAADAQRHGRPQIVIPRLGQSSFRLAVLEAYGGACAVTTEHSLPVLEAAHIQRRSGSVNGAVCGCSSCSGLAGSPSRCRRLNGSLEMVNDGGLAVSPIAAGRDPSARRCS